MRRWMIGFAMLVACGPRVAVPGEDEGGSAEDSADEADPTTGPRDTTSTTAPPPTATVPPTMTTAPPPDIPEPWDVGSPTVGPVDPPLEGIWLCTGALLPFTLEIFAVEGEFPIGEVCIPGIEPVGPEGWTDCAETVPHGNAAFSFDFATELYSEALGENYDFEFGFEYDVEFDALVGATFNATEVAETRCERYD